MSTPKGKGDAIRAFIKDYTKQPDTAVRDSASLPANPPGNRTPPAQPQQPTGPAQPTTDATDVMILKPILIAYDDQGKQTEHTPEAGKKGYYFVARIRNEGKQPSGPLFVKFTVSGDADWGHQEDLDNGLNPKENKTVAVKYEQAFALRSEYELEIAVYSEKDPDQELDSDHTNIIPIREYRGKD